MTNSRATAKSALSLLKGRVAERRDFLHQQAAGEGEEGALIAAEELDGIIRMIEEEMARLD